MVKALDSPIERFLVRISVRIVIFFLLSLVSASVVGSLSLGGRSSVVRESDFKSEDPGFDPLAG